ncbi:MAG: LysM peptidoglycan-binding domain-containing protein [Anaerolineae bacterium]|nr:LysM peptidoglycan-binding domain-containing protein [Anaerolineae bacterium]
MKTVRFITLLWVCSTLFLAACRQEPEVLPLTFPPVTLPIPGVTESITATFVPPTVTMMPIISSTVEGVAIVDTAEPSLTPTSEPSAAAPTPCSSPPSWWVIYIVQPGDTVGHLARRTGVTIEQIQQANCLADVNLIFRGQRLYLPFIPPTAVPPATIIVLATLIPPDPTDPTIAVLPATGTPGAAFNISIKGFPPNTSVTLDIIFRLTTIYSVSAITTTAGEYQFIYQSEVAAAPGNYTARITAPDISLNGLFTITTP